MTMQTFKTKYDNHNIVPGVSPEIYSQRDFERIAALVREQAGIVLPQGKKMLAYSRIAPLLRDSQHSKFSEFLDSLDNDPKLSVATIAALTTNHTYFNREPHHFEHFAKHVRPSLIRRAAEGDAIRIWSAGCSSGEEIWTLMMVFLGEDRVVGKQLLRQDVIALASDLAKHVLIKAATAVYSAEAAPSIPNSLFKNWCEQDEKTFRLKDEVKKIVRFRQLNLLRDWPLNNFFDIIFCRNVMIYFDHSSKQELVLKLTKQLRPGGFLYIGHSERALGPATDLLECVGPTIYRRKSA